MTSLAIICEGKEISYGLNLKHLLVFKNDKTDFKSNLGNGVNAEIYTSGSFAHAHIAKDTFRIFVNKDANSSSAKLIYNGYGIQILKDGYNYYVLANAQNLLNADYYYAFINKANEKKSQYNQFEAEYVNKVKSQDKDWFPHDFFALSAKGLLGKNKLLKDMLQQQFDYAMYVIYMAFATGDEEYVR